MDKSRNILEDKNMRLNAFSVPADYFSDLEKRLSGIPERRKGIRRTAAIISIAASLAVIATAGLMLISKPSEQRYEFEAYIYNSYQSGDPVSLFTETEDYSPSHDDIIEYLIYTGTNVEYLAYE